MDYSTIFTKEEMDRIRPVIRDGEVKYLAIDVHGMAAGRAINFIRSTICLTSFQKDHCTLAVIHRFRHGSSIRDTIRSGEKKLTNRPLKIKPASRNPGMTFLEIS